MFWGIVIGVAVGYFFKPQIDRVVHRAIRAIKDNRKDNDTF